MISKFHAGIIYSCALVAAKHIPRLSNEIHFRTLVKHSSNDIILSFLVEDCGPKSFLSVGFFKLNLHCVLKSM